MLCNSVKSKRPRTVIDHILKHGFITTDELNDTYGYDHPPRAIRDVRENGIPLQTHRVVSPKTGRKIAAYTFGGVGNIRRGRIGGRKAFSKKFKKLLIERYGARDAFTGEPLEERYLQIDHRIPYPVAGEEHTENVNQYMLIDATSQRAKSWSCEHCENFLSFRGIENCKSCFWAFPESYTHIAMKQKRRVDVVWEGKETCHYDVILERANKENVSIQEYIKRLVQKQI